MNRVCDIPSMAWVLVLVLVLFPAAVLAQGAPASPSPTPAVRLGTDVVPTSQSIRLRLDADRPDYSGTVAIELEVRVATDRFRFHSEGPELTRLVLRGPQGEIETVWEAESDELVAVETTAPLASGAYTLEIDFTNPFDTQAVSLYRMEQDGTGYVFSQFQADDAREAFPCWDEPAFKIPYRVTVAVPEGHLAITNTPVATETVADGWRTTVFAATPPLPSYLLAIASGPLEAVPMPGLGVPGRLVTVRGQSHLTAAAAAMTPPILKALERYFGSPYPFAKLDFLALPEFWPGAMENPGAITYADRLLLLDPATASVAQRRRLAGVIAHELAHMWFGDLVTMEWWDDLWLNESFATWMGDKILPEVFPELDQEVAAIQGIQGILSQDSRATTEAVRRPIDSAKDLLSGIGLTYRKGRTVLGMFEQWMGPETFRRGVVAYLEAHAWKNATAADLWRALDQASGKEVAAAMATFLDQPGFPRIDVEVLAGGRVKLTQERFRNHGATAPGLVWQVPVALSYGGDEGGGSETVLLSGSTRTVDLGVEPEGRTPEGRTPAWVFPNAGAHGYYRWSLPGDRLRHLAENAGELLTRRERVELIGNLSALLAAGTLSGDDYLRLLGELAGDPDPTVINTLAAALRAVKMAFVPEDLEEPFAAYVRRTLGPALERFGQERVAGEAEAVSLVRPQLWTWLGREGRDPEVLGLAGEVARAYLAGDPERRAAVDPSLAGVALDLAAIGGGRELFDEYRRRFEAARSPTERARYLGALGAFDNPELKQAAYDYALEGPLRPNEIFAVGRANDAASRDLGFRWLTTNWDALMERMPPAFASFMPFFASGCSAERLGSAREFFAQPEHRGPATDKQLAKVGEQVEDCVRLRAREGEAVARYLRGEE